MGAAGEAEAGADEGAAVEQEPRGERERRQADATAARLQPWRHACRVPRAPAWCEPAGRAGCTARKATPACTVARRAAQGAVRPAAQREGPARGAAPAPERKARDRPPARCRTCGDAAGAAGNRPRQRRAQLGGCAREPQGGRVRLGGRARPRAAVPPLVVGAGPPPVALRGQQQDRRGVGQRHAPPQRALRRCPRAGAAA